ncbi:hypothetical protein SAMN05421856_10683 [Chryseobacterium taichungense]|uniref:Uncharacterized protein n=1 Tax=Chryseobacterium taichungense TaxID=295069 RepID=A0A1H8AUD4_9FLAO|nr:hypothetical protein [Chryseobacterium taichungense]SEM74330.1 hypothetical protein SAMN05421856_10683 [Chryseobacterium taichungense]
MKSIVQKTKIIILFLTFSLAFAQQRMKMPADVLFYMEINGQQLGKKINWQKFNPILQEVTKKGKGKEKASWTDYSKTGIKYDAPQYHYASFNDSVQVYSAHFIVDNKDKFQEFINSVKKDGLEVSTKRNYSYVNLDDDVFVAWNDRRAVLKMINYNKPFKDELAADSTVAVVDSAVAVAPDSASIEEPEKPFDYKEEINYLKDDIKYLKESIKDNNAEIQRIQKDIKYLEKHHEYPKEKKGATDENYSGDTIEVEPAPGPEEDREDLQIPEYDDFKKEMDSLKIEKFKVLKKLAEESFDQYFNSNLELDVPKEMTAFRDAGSDVFVYTDYGSLVNNGAYGKMMRQYEFGNLFNSVYNSNSSYNLYFDKDKVKLVNSYQHKNPEVQKSFSEIYKGKKNKKLARLINDKSIGYYAMNVDGSKYFDMMYALMKNAGDSGYQKETELIMETVKIVLDEKAIAKIAPGNGIFVLNELKSKTVEYTDYEYDDDYNEKEVKKTKEVVVPDFTFAFATENPGYWNRIFDLLATNKKTSKHFSRNGNLYTFKEDKETGFMDQLYFKVRDNIVYVMSSENGLEVKNQSDKSKIWMKESSKYPASGRFDIQKLLVGLEKEFKSTSERKMLDLVRKNVGEVNFKSESKGDKIETEINYSIKNASENSLMYFFDLFDEIYKLQETDKKQPVL